MEILNRERRHVSAIVLADCAAGVTIPFQPGAATLDKSPL